MLGADRESRRFFVPLRTEQSRGPSESSIGALSSKHRMAASKGPQYVPQSQHGSRPVCSKAGMDRRRAAFQALLHYPGGLQVGGGVTDTNAAEWLDAGASHVIVTSHVFSDGKLQEERLQRLVALLASAA